MAARKRSLGVTINTGELPSAKGVEEGYDLAMVIGRWQHVAHSSFRYDCRALKQMIAETDELRLWEKNVGGFKFANRDQFLREKVLIDYELTERDMAEIVGMLNRDDPDAVQERLKRRGRPKKGEEKVGNTNISKGGSTAAYILARLDRDGHAELAAKVRAKTMSANAAAQAAGYRKNQTPLQQIQKLWVKLDAAGRKAHLKWTLAHCATCGREGAWMSKDIHGNPVDLLHGEWCDACCEEGQRETLKEMTKEQREIFERWQAGGMRVKQ